MCEYCNFDNGFDNNKRNFLEQLEIRRIGENCNNYYLVHGRGQYDEYDSYDVETQIHFCPICGRKLD